MTITAPVPTKVIVFGATGNIGKFITEALCKSPSFEKVGIFTSSGTAEKKAAEIGEYKSRGIEVIIADLNSGDDVLKAFEGRIRLTFLPKLAIKL